MVRLYNSRRYICNGIIDYKSVYTNFNKKGMLGVVLRQALN